MNFRSHSDLKDKHAFLSPSSYHWLNYTDDKLVDTYKRMRMKERGTRLHELAASLIKEGVKLPRTKETLNMYVNDAIGFKMNPEQTLYYSDNSFGTADAICIRKNVLRIHDLKTGETPASMKQLYVYAALFCLEYGYKPGDLQFILQIYQNNEIQHAEPGPDEILPVMDTIIRLDRILKTVQEDEK